MFNDPVNIVISVIIAAILFFAIIYGIKKAKGGCCSGGGYKVRKVKATIKNKSKYSYRTTAYICGMTCTNCKTRVENAFNRKGHFAKVDLRKKCAVIFSIEPIAMDEAEALIAKDGYVLTDIRSEKL